MPVKSIIYLDVLSLIPTTKRPDTASIVSDRGAAVRAATCPVRPGTVFRLWLQQRILWDMSTHLGQVSFGEGKRSDFVPNRKPGLHWNWELVEHDGFLCGTNLTQLR